jgi:hypothetical protein
MWAGTGVREKNSDLFAWKNFGRLRIDAFRNRSCIWIGIKNGNPDRHQNDADPQHWFWFSHLYFIQVSETWVILLIYYKMLSIQAVDNTVDKKGIAPQKAWRKEIVKNTELTFY